MDHFLESSRYFLHYAHKALCLAAYPYYRYTSYGFGHSEEYIQNT